MGLKTLFSVGGVSHTTKLLQALLGLRLWQKTQSEDVHPWIGIADLVPDIGQRGIFSRHSLATASLSLPFTIAKQMPTLHKNTLMLIFHNVIISSPKYSRTIAIAGDMKPLPQRRRSVRLRRDNDTSNVER